MITWPFLVDFEAALAAGFDPAGYLHAAEDGPRVCYTPTSCPTNTTELDEDGILQCEHHTFLEDEKLWKEKRNRLACDLLFEALQELHGTYYKGPEPTPEPAPEVLEEVG